MIAKLIILIVLIALHYKPTFSSELEPTTEGSTTGVTADPIITNLKNELCRGDAILYKDCQYKEVAGKVTKRNCERMDSSNSRTLERRAGWRREKI